MNIGKIIKNIRLGAIWCLTPFYPFLLPFLFALIPVCAKAAEADVMNIPAPYVVFSIEQVPNCKGCPSYNAKFYSNSTYHFEGKEGVWALGEFGDFKYWEILRTADPARESSPGEAQVWRKEYLKGLATFRSSAFMDRMKSSLVDTGFFDADFSVPAKSGKTTAKSQFHIHANWGNRKRSLVVPDDQVPPQLQTVVDKFLSAGIAGFPNPAPPFWSDDDAKLRITEHGGSHMRCENVTGITLYQSGKAVLFGWNKLTRNNRFEVINSAIDPARAQEIFAGFDRGQEQLDPRRWAYGSTTAIVDGKYWSHAIGDVLNSPQPSDHITHIVIYKLRPNSLQGVPRDTLLKVRDLWGELRARLIPDDPAKVESCRTYGRK